jgi:hypothetical protein
MFMETTANLPYPEEIQSLLNEIKPLPLCLE